MENKKPSIRLLRIGTAALFAELIPLAVLVATITGYGFLAPDQDKAAYEQFAEKAGSYVGPIAGTVATFGMAYWAARKPENARLLHGLLTGALVVLLDFAIFATPKADFDVMDILILLAKFAAGALAGFLAQRRYHNQPIDARKSHRVI